MVRANRLRLGYRIAGSCVQQVWMSIAKKTQPNSGCMPDVIHTKKTLELVRLWSDQVKEVTQCHHVIFFISCGYAI